MWSDIQAPMFFGLVAAFVTTVGLIVVAQRRDWSARFSALFALAAGGMLLTLTLLHIAPEALARTASAPAFILSGFLGGLVLSHASGRLFSGLPSGLPVAAAITPVFAIAAHSFLDGIIYAVTFAASFEAGVFAATSLIVHEVPEGIIAFAILRGQGVSNRNAFIFAFFAAAATTPLGVAASAPFFHSVGPEMVGSLFALSAGLLLYVATGPLMAPLRTEPPLRGAAALGLGVVLAVALTYSPLNGHASPDTLGHGGALQAAAGPSHG